MKQPHVADVDGIVDAIRRQGSVHYRIEDVPGEFAEWRRRVRQAAKRAGLRISVQRTRNGFVLVEFPEWEESDAERMAVADVLDGVWTGKRVSYEDAVKRRRREQLRVVRDGE